MNKGDIEIQVQIEPGDYWLSDPVTLSRTKIGCLGWRHVTSVRKIIL